jgi:hypothetical protein
VRQTSLLDPRIDLWISLVEAGVKHVGNLIADCGLWISDLKLNKKRQSFE